MVDQCLPSQDPEVSSSMILGSRGPSATMFSRTAFTLSLCCHSVGIQLRSKKGKRKRIRIMEKV